MATSNLFAAFRALLPSDPLLAGEVVAYDGTTATVQLPDGRTVAARGSTELHAQVFVQGGVIQGPAPALGEVVIEV